MNSATTIPHTADTIGILCALFVSQLDLEPRQAVVYNQRKKLPDTPGIQIDVEFLASRQYGQSKIHEEDENGYQEIIGLQQQETYTVNIYSHDESALTRKWEITAALMSDQAQHLQEQYSFHLGLIPASFVDVSRVEGAGRLNRFAITIVLTRAYEKRRLVESYSNFSGSPALYLDPSVKPGNPIILANP